MSGRMHRAVVDGQSSQWSPVTSGVPQGSILDPLLFILYIRDVSDGLNSQVRLFADDCALFHDVRSRDLNGLFRWS